MHLRGTSQSKTKQNKQTNKKTLKYVPSGVISEKQMFAGELGSEVSVPNMICSAEKSAVIRHLVESLNPKN